MMHLCVLGRDSPLCNLMMHFYVLERDSTLCKLMMRYLVRSSLILNLVTGDESDDKYKTPSYIPIGQIHCPVTGEVIHEYFAADDDKVIALGVLVLFSLYRCFVLVLTLLLSHFVLDAASILLPITFH